MIGMNFKLPGQSQMHFFDRSILSRNWKRINKNPYARAGAYTMGVARRSIKRRQLKLKSGRRPKPSPPGQPPRSRQPGKLPPMKQIFMDELNAGVIVGMAGFGNTYATPIPALHEHGGFARRRVFVKVSGNEDHLQRERRRGKGGRFVKGGRLRDKRTGRFAKAKKDKMKAQMKMVRYPKRPFMEPALIKAKPMLPKMWGGSITKKSIAA